jgi:hypothetical protein
MYESTEGAQLMQSQPKNLLLDQINQEIKNGPYYQQNFSNDGERFVAWYLRRVLLRDAVATRYDITDGANDKQIDAVIVDDEESRVLIIQGKFIAASQVDGEPLREVLSAWVRLQDLSALQEDCNEKLKVKMEAVRKALDDDYRVEFELITTGVLTDGAKADLTAFSDKLEESDDFTASFHVVDTEVLQTRLAEAEAMELPSLDHVISIDPVRRWSRTWARPKQFLRPYLFGNASDSPVFWTANCFGRTCDNL